MTEGAPASTTQTWPRAKVMGAPVVVVNVVPPLPPGQDQRMAQESPPARYERWIARSLATLLPATQRPPVNQASKPPEQGNLPC